MQTLTSIRSTARQVHVFALLQTNPHTIINNNNNNNLNRNSTCSALSAFGPSPRPRPWVKFVLALCRPPYPIVATPPPKRKQKTAGEVGAATIQGASSSLDTASLEFSSEEAYHEHLKGQGKLPLGFRVGTDGLRFVPQEVPTESTMNVTAIVLDEVCVCFLLCWQY